MPGEVAVPEAMRHAVAAAEGLPHEALLGAAGGAAAARRPLLAAFACARLRTAAMLLDKAPWQQMVIEVGGVFCLGYFSSLYFPNSALLFGARGMASALPGCIS